MELTGRLVSGARGLADISQQQLADLAGTTKTTIAKFENGDGGIRKPLEQRIIEAFYNLDIEFTEDGVKFRTGKVKEIKGSDCFIKFFEIILAKINKGDEILFFCSSDKVSPPIINELLCKIRSKGANFRHLIEEDDTYLMGKLEEYHYLPKEYYHNELLVIYKDCIASLLGKNKSIVIIEDKGMANSLKNLFDFIWSVTKKPTETITNERY